MSAIIFQSSGLSSRLPKKGRGIPNLRGTKDIMLVPGGRVPGEMENSEINVKFSDEDPTTINETHTRFGHSVLNGTITALGMRPASRGICPNINDRVDG